MSYTGTVDLNHGQANRMYYTAVLVKGYTREFGLPLRERQLEDPCMKSGGPSSGIRNLITDPRKNVEHTN